VRDPRGIVGIPARRRPARRVAPALAGTLLVAAPLVAATPAPAGQLRELAREATPLVLKDGRIAHVAIWAVPFRPGANDLDPEVKAELAGLVETLATDCFLTAQAIGHVEPEAAKAGDTLTAHRLARARADRIQQAMVERGLQASAIASVWDWQFLVKEPRVTVWVFRLHEGEDCQGKRLERPAAAATGSPLGARELPVRSNLASTGTAERPAAERPAPASPAATAEPPRPLAGPAARTAPASTSSTTPAETPARGEATAPMPGSTPPPRPVIAARQPQPRQPAPSLPGASAAAEEVAVGSPEAAEEPAARPQPTSAPPAVSQPAAVPTPTAQTAATAQTVPVPTATDQRGGSTRAPARTAATNGPTPAPPSRPLGESPAGGSPPAKPLATAGASSAEAASGGADETGARSRTAEAGPGAETAEASAGARLAAIDPGVVRGPSGLEIVFDVNSSYLPKGAAAELRRFVKDLPTSGTIRLAIVAAVGGADVKEAGGSSGLRYNRWLAERRIGRVADWLKENAGGRRLEIRTGFADDDPSRRVTVRLEAGG